MTQIVESVGFHGSKTDTRLLGEEGELEYRGRTTIEFGKEQ
jgi:hypothetical protein